MLYPQSAAVHCPGLQIRFRVWVRQEVMGTPEVRRMAVSIALPITPCIEIG